MIYKFWLELNTLCKSVLDKLCLNDNIFLGNCVRYVCLYSN